MTMRVIRPTGLAALLSILGACHWFDSANQCVQGSTSCDGDSIRSCSPSYDPNAESGTSLKWQVVQSCSDYSALGTLTCGMRGGVAQCVALGPDGGSDAGTDGQAGEEGDAVSEGGAETAVAPDPATVPSSWLRADVSTTDGGAVLEPVTHVVVEGTPASAARGELAAVAYGPNGAIIDATLVPALVGVSNATAWLQAPGATRVDLVNADGKVVATQPVSADDAGVEDEGSGEDGGVPVPNGLSSLVCRVRTKIPSVVHVVQPGEDLFPPLGGRVITPSGEQLALLGAVLHQVPNSLLSALPKLAFVASGTVDSRNEEPADLADDAGCLNVSPNIDTSPVGPLWGTRTRAEATGTTLYVDVSADLMKDYRENLDARTTFYHEVLHYYGEAWANIASGSTADLALPFTKTAKLPADFPPLIAQAIRNRVFPMLGPFETFDLAWSGLHSAAVDEGLAQAYDQLGVAKVTDSAAASLGFASGAGARSVQQDVAEYVAYATLGEAWRFGPCVSIRAKPVDQLAPILFPHIAKLHALWGLGLIKRERLETCVGGLPFSDVTKAGITVHKASGQTELFDTNVGAVRTAYLQGETHVSAFGAVGDLHAMVDLMYKGLLPGIVRLNPAQNARTQDVGAMFAMTDDKGGITSPSRGGLVIFSRVTPELVEGRIFMAIMGAKIMGSKAFPLVTIRIPKPVWPTITGGYEGQP
jgi:hypothetical protein